VVLREFIELEHETLDQDALWDVIWHRGQSLNNWWGKKKQNKEQSHRQQFY